MVSKWQQNVSRLFSKRGAATTIHTIFPSYLRISTSHLLLEQRLQHTNVGHILFAASDESIRNITWNSQAPPQQTFTKKSRFPFYVFTGFELTPILTRKSLVKNVISIWGSLARKFPVKGVPNHFSWKRQNGTIFVVSRIPSKWYQSDTKMNTKWYQTDTKMKPKWYHNEFKLTAKWYQNDTIMNSKWNQNGIKMIAKCLQNVLQARSGLHTIFPSYFRISTSHLLLEQRLQHTNVGHILFAASDESIRNTPPQQNIHKEIALPVLCLHRFPC